LTESYVGGQFVGTIKMNFRKRFGVAAGAWTARRERTLGGIGGFHPLRLPRGTNARV
jgi:hypothetical protein